MQQIECKAAGPNQAIGELSGGNQQKIAIARLLHQQAPTCCSWTSRPAASTSAPRPRSTACIGELAAAGKAIVLVSSYLPELLNVCDRIGVMCRGRLREVRAAKDWTEEEVMQCATGSTVEAASAARSPVESIAEDKR